MTVAWAWVASTSSAGRPMSRSQIACGSLTSTSQKSVSAVITSCQLVEKSSDFHDP